MLGQRFTHYCNLNLTAPRHPALISRDFNALVRELKKVGLVAHSTIEINRENVVHWHILFREYCGTKETLKKLVDSCVAKVATFPENRTHTAKIRNQKNYLGYCFKVKKPGWASDTTRTPSVPDIYKLDRVLFKPKTGLAKHGTIGDFWAEGWNEKKLWKVIREEAKQVRKNLENPRIRKLVESIHDLIGGSLRRIQWAYGLNPPRHLLEPPDSSDEPRSIRRPSRSGTGSLLAEIFGRSGLNNRPKAVGPPSRTVHVVPSPLPTPVATAPNNWFFSFLEASWEFLKFLVRPLFKNTG